VSIVLAMFDQCVYHVWPVCISCLTGVYIMFDRCVYHVWPVCISCLTGVYIMFDQCVYHVWPVCISCLTSVYIMFDRCVYHVWPVCISCLTCVYIKFCSTWRLYRFSRHIKQSFYIQLHSQWLQFNRKKFFKNMCNKLTFLTLY
jgi:hypothetical protein